MSVAARTIPRQAYRIGSININTIQSHIKLQLLRDMLRASDLDIALLQEVRLESFPDIYGYDTYITPYADNGSGTAILLKEGIVVDNVINLPSGRGLAVTLNGVRIINVYAPSGTDKRRERSRFFSEEVTPLFDGRYDQIILGGDFNCVLSQKDQYPHFNTCQELKLLIQQLKLTDTWEQVHGDRSGYTYVTSHSASRLDRVYVSNELRTATLDAELWPAAFSDHVAYICTLSLQRQTVWRSRGTWKLNVSHLKDLECRQHTEVTWKNCEKRIPAYPSTLRWWLECAKPALRRTMIQYGRDKMNWHRNTMEFYFTVLRELCDSAPSPERQIEVQRIKAKIISLTRRRLEGAMIRARCQDRICGEPPSMHHIIGEKKRYRRALVSALERSDGRRLTSQNDIVAAFVDHYQQLYAEADNDDVAMDDVLHSLPGALDDAAGELLMETITPDDLAEALHTGAANKSPGPDGFPLEFYRAFQDIMAPRWIEMYQELMTPDLPLPPAFVEGLIIPVPKPSRGHTVNHYRPLTMLNCDFKIFTRILAARLRRVVPKVISVDQTCLGVGSNIQTALSDYRDVIALATTCRLRGALVSVDFDHAFDRVSHDFLEAVMRRMAFPPAFIHIVLRLLRGATSQVLVNGRVSGTVTISRSVRQGCPLSMILFATALEPLLYGLRHRLTGITMTGRSFICRAYADDLLFLVRSGDEVRVALEWIARYGTAAGSRMNLTKSCAMNIGRGLPEGSVAPLQMMDTIKCLGITFTRDIQRTAAVNYKRLLQVTRATVRGNLLRSLDMLQRVAFVNTHLASRIPHLAQILPMPKTMAQRLQAAFGYFVSGGLIFKVRYDTLTLPPRDGGLGLVNVRIRAAALYVTMMLKLWKRSQNGLSGVLIDELAPLSTMPPVAVAHISPSLSHIKTFFIEYSYVHADLLPTRNSTTRDVYRIMMRGHARNIVESRHPAVAWPVVWRSVHHALLDTDARATWYLVVNEKFMTRQRLHAINMTNSPLCPQCNVMDSDEHRLMCGPSAEIWLLIRKILAFLLRTAPHAIVPQSILFPDETFFPRTKTNAVNWIKGLSIYYLFHDRDKSILDFWAFLQDRFTLIMHNSRHRQYYANFLGSVFLDPPHSWGVPGMRR